MNTRIFEAFEEREKEVSAYMAGCGSKYGMPCTCGPNCKCTSCSEHCRTQQQQQQQLRQQQQQEGADINAVDLVGAAAPQDQHYGGGAPAADGACCSGGAAVAAPPALPDRGVAERNNSMFSFSGRRMSLMSEATFGRAMSGLSALSIDWENMEDFDINIDLSANINEGADNQIATGAGPSTNQVADFAGVSPQGRRSSLRRSFVNSGTDEGGPSGMHVSFKV
jgi:hypothetical protein